jgi:hypothetical protein
MMNWDQVVADWQRIEPLLTSKWSKLTEEDMPALRESREPLADALERRYGIQKKHAELQVTRWLADLKPTPGASAAGGS